MNPSPKAVSPGEVLKTVVDAIPPNVRSHVIVIGSLAAAYWHWDRTHSFSVRTKDIDTVLVPRTTAPRTGREVADHLLQADWKPKKDGEFARPGDENTPDDRLPALRLYPPTSDDWFLELLTEPEADTQTTRQFMRFILSNGEHYGLPSFRFTGIATFQAVEIDLGVRVAKPEMMALANLLEHPEIGPQLIKDTTIKRSNKDLGRALALAWLSKDPLESWSDAWFDALRELFPTNRKVLAKGVGHGIEALLASENDFEQAVMTCNTGLLASRNVTSPQLRATAKRLLELVVRELLARRE